LEDFARLWVCGVTSNLLAQLPPGTTITLDWGDVGNPNTSNPVNGTTPPSPFVSQGRAWGLITSAPEAEVIAADTTIQGVCPACSP